MSTTVTNKELAIVSVSAAPRLRLDFLDGLRGLAALYVVCFHIQYNIGGMVQPHRMFRYLLSWARYGRYSVTIFIVLSGFSLMLPIVRSSDGLLKGGWQTYLKRRAWRILPPYYAALALYLLLLWHYPLHGPDLPYTWTSFFPIRTPQVLISHITLFQDLSENWIYKINGAFWSIAVEWHIYFFLPLILLPVWRRFGAAAMVLTAFLIGLFPHFILHNRYDYAAPWFLGCFALGMAGAVICFWNDEKVIRFRRAVPWHTVSKYGMVALLFFLAYLYKMGYQKLSSYWVNDIIISLITTVFLIACTLHPEKMSAPIRLLQSPLVRKLGLCSYSLYLVHNLALISVFDIAHKLHLSAAGHILIGYLVALPLAIGLASLFYITVERPTMRYRAKMDGK